MKASKIGSQTKTNSNYPRAVTKVIHIQNNVRLVLLLATIKNRLKVQSERSSLN